MVSFSYATGTLFMVKAESASARKKRVKEELDAMDRDAARLFSPLGRVSTIADVETYLRMIERDYFNQVQRRSVIFQQAGLGLSDLIKIVNTAASEIDPLDRIEQILGEDAAEQMQAALASFFAFLQTVMKRLYRALEGDQSTVFEPPYNNLALDRAVYSANATMHAIWFIIRGDIQQWTQDGLRVLISACDEFVSRIEDEFLAAAPISAPQPTVPASQLSHVLKVPA